MPELVRRRRHGIERRPRHSGMHLEQVVARGLLVLHHLDRNFGRGRGVAIEARAGRVDRRTQQLALCDRGSQRQVPRIAEHAANRRDAIGHEQREHAMHVRVGRLSARNVRVHLGHARHQELAAAIDARRTVWHLSVGAATHRDDAIAADDDGLIAQRPIAIHRDDRDVRERDSWKAFASPAGPLA